LWPRAGGGQRAFHTGATVLATLNALRMQVMASQLPINDFINLGVDQADASGSPPTTRQQGCDAAVSFEFDPPSTYGRAIHPEDACGLSQRQANIGSRIRQGKGNDICLAARFGPGRVISIRFFHSSATCRIA
jgi:hypothetical protein